MHPTRAPEDPLENMAWIGLGVLAALGAAGVAIFGKLGLAGVDSTLATTLRSCVMTLALLLFAVGTGRVAGLLEGARGLDRRGWAFIALAGLSGAASWLAYFAALERGPAGPVAALDRSSLLWVVLFAWLFLGERYGARAWAGAALVVAGILLIVGAPAGRAV